jgi:5'-deoxynucleotidase YfbR-like HD superfamily hydrolase
MQTCAEHSWNVARLFWKFYPDKWTAEVAIYIMFHDSGEIGVGDIPFPVKRDNPTLKGYMDELERTSLKKQGIVLPELTMFEKALIKICDLLEMFEFGCEEMRRGNAYGEPIVRATIDGIGKYATASPFDLRMDNIKMHLNIYKEGLGL